MVLKAKSYNRSVMMKELTRMVSAIFSVLLISSCSIKEDRDSCPCLLILDLSENQSVGVTSADLIVTDAETVVWKDEMDMTSVSDRYSLYVPRNLLHLRLWGGTDGLASDNGLSIPFRQSCPEVYMYDADLLMEGESCVAKVRLRKNHCVMTVTGKDAERLPFDMKVTGGVSGYDAVGKPVEGEFECVPDEDGKAVLPRQTDDSLLLHVSGDGTDVRTFALGHYLASSGYDWSSPDLEDVTVTLDYALTEVRIAVEGWEGVYVYDMVM